MDRGTGQATVHGIAKSQTRLSDFHFQIPIYKKIKKKKRLQINVLTSKVKTLETKSKLNLM